MKNIVRLAVAALACCLAWQVLAHRTSTHQELSLQAAAISNLFVDPTLLSNLGLGPWGARDYTDSKGVSRTVQEIIGFGSEWEDVAQFCRPLNHFFDPQFQNFTGRGLDASGGSFDGQPSPDWALEDRGEVSNAACAQVIQQIDSYRHAQQQYLTMLTAQSPTSRHTAASSMFQTLGMVIHHIQDMAQPQHTRNDTHLSLPASFYERYTQGNADTRIAQGQFTNAYPIPAFPTARQFWHSVASQTDLQPRYVGMAEFTGQNYVSPGSLFSISANGTIANNPDFPLPNGVNFDGTPKRVDRITVSQSFPNGTVQTEVMEYVVGSVFDGFRNQSSPNRLLASRSIMSGPNASGRPTAWTVGPKEFENNYDLLLPRAIAFSAGLINHFFRGRMNLRRNPSGSGWLIENVGQHDMNGAVAIYYDDAADARQWITGASWSAVIPAGQSISVSFTEPPAETKRLVAVFVGRIGAEGDPAAPASGFFTTAGITYIPCGIQPILESRFGNEQTLTIGSDTQTVTARFNAYGDWGPDKLELLANGIRLAGTDGFVFGEHSITFTFDPKKLGTTQLLARVTKTDERSGWDLCVHCNNPANPDGVCFIPVVSP